MKKIIITLSVLTLLFATTACGKKDEEDTSLKTNTNQFVIAEQEVSGIRFSNVSLSRENKVSTFKVDLSNTTDQTISVFRVKVIFINENGETIEELYLGNIPNIEVNQTTTQTVTTETDLMSATIVVYELEA